MRWRKLTVRSRGLCVCARARARGGFGRYIPKVLADAVLDEEGAEKKRVVKRLQSGDPAPECERMLALKSLGKRAEPKLTIEVEGWQPISAVAVDQRDWLGTFVLQPTWQPHPVRLFSCSVDHISCFPWARRSHKLLQAQRRSHGANVFCTAAIAIASSSVDHTSAAGSAD